VGKIQVESSANAVGRRRDGEIGGWAGGEERRLL